MNKNLNKKSQSGLAAIIISLFVLTSSAFLATNITLNGSAVSDMQFDNFIEKTADIEIWANTSIDLEITNNSINAILKLDNQTILPEQEIEFYLNENLIAKEKTDSEGYVQSSFDFSKISLGIYSLKAEFLGNPSLYLNPSSITIENLDLGETNQTLNITNATFEGLCQEFEEQILWSSGYSLLPSGSLNYEIWYPKYNCTELGVSDCFIENIKIKTRFISIDFPDLKRSGEGYVQISEPNNSICDNPKKGKYLQYLANETLIGEDRKMKDYCGKKDCEIESFENYGFSDCYGIKIYGDQYMITDIFEVTYSLCYSTGEENENK